MSADLASIKKELERLLARYYERRVPEEFEPGKTPVTVGYAVYGYEEVRRALEALLSGWISMGPACREFEQEFARWVGSPYGVAVNSGSSANLLAYTALVQRGELPPGSEVIVPSTTFTTAVSPILQVGLRPVFVDVDPLTYNISADEVEKAAGPTTKAIMVVHTLGVPADMGPILETARRRRLIVIEDCCEAHGTSYNGKKVGTFGRIATFSFYVAHNMTTGEGGMILTREQELDEMLRSLREFGRSRQSAPIPFSYSDGVLSQFDNRYIFQRLGYNLRMTDVTAALGIEQLKKLDGLNRQRIETAAFYTEGLKPYEEFLQTPTVPAGAIHTYYAYPIVVREGSPFTRSELTRFLEQKKVETRALFGGSLAHQPAYRELGLRQSGDLRVSRWLRDNCFFIGCHPKVGPAERGYVLRCIAEFMEPYLRGTRLFSVPAQIRWKPGLQAQE